MNISNKTFIVTGGGNGLGRELVLSLLKRGNNVIAFDINEFALQETYKLAGDLKSRFSPVTVDITNKDLIDEIVDKTVATFGQIDGIINNAGVIQPFTTLENTDFATIKKVFDINFFGTLYMIKAFLPHLLTRPEAWIVDVSSMGGFLPVPGQAIYGASKAAVKILTESLASELDGTNVHVTTVFPGAIATDIKSNSGLGKDAGVNASDCAEIPKGLLSPAAAADIIIKATEHKKVRSYVGNDAKLMFRWYRAFPNWASRIIGKKVKENHKM